MAKAGKAAPIDKSKNVWEVYWHSLDEWGNMIYNWACNNGFNNSVCTLFELREGDNTADQGRISSGNRLTLYSIICLFKHFLNQIKL